MLSAKDILAAVDHSIESVAVPEWGGEVGIRTMTGKERDRWELFITKEMEKSGHVNIRARLVSIVACDEEGKRLFDDKQVEELGKKSAKALDRIYSAAARLNKLSDEDIEALAGN